MMTEVLPFDCPRNHSIVKLNTTCQKFIIKIKKIKKKQQQQNLLYTESITKMGQNQLEVI